MKIRLGILGLSLLALDGCQATGGLGAGARQSVISEKLFSVAGRPGARVDVLVLRPAEPKAAAVLLIGGDGILDLAQDANGPMVGRGRGFLGANREIFAAHGLLVALPDAPLDQPQGLSPRFRNSAEHTRDLDAVIVRLRKETRLPIWLIGVSRGSLSAAYQAVHGRQAVDGIVLTSSPTRIPPRSGATRVSEMGLEGLKISDLALGHAEDNCPGTPPEGAREIVRRSIASSRVKAMIVTGGGGGGPNPCGIHTPHTYEGIEGRVIAAIAAFIKSDGRAATN